MPFSELGVFALVVVVLFALARWLRRIRIYFDRSWLPPDLQDAELVYVERLFRVTEPFPIVARLDRGYRGPNGVIVLVELKTRRANRPYLSDVIELSAQRFALQAQTGQRVADYGYVLIRRSEGGARVLHRVNLLSTEQVFAVALRREAILEGRAIPRCTLSKGLCARCAFEQQCKQTVDGRA